MTRRIAAVTASLALFSLATASAQHIERQSVSSAEAEGDLKSPAAHRLGVSLGARYLGFTSQSTNLVSGDTNGYSDVFVRDRANGTTLRVSTSSSGVQGDGTSNTPAMSRDGRFVGFYSLATTISPPDVNQKGDYFVHDRDPDGNGVFDEGNATITRINRRPDGIQSVSPPPAYTFSQIDISADGRYVAIVSGDSDLLTTADTNNQDDFFVVDRDPDGNGIFESSSFLTRRASESTSGTPGNGPSTTGAIAADGSWVVFESQSTNLIAGDNNWVADIYCKQVGGATLALMSKAVNGPIGDGPSLSPDISGDGRYVVFASSATNLVVGDHNEVQDVFLRDRDPDGDGVFDEGNATTIRLSQLISITGAVIEANNHSHSPTISDDGLRITFHTDATNLFPDDYNNRADLLLVNRDPDGDGFAGPGLALHCLSKAPNGDNANEASTAGSLSPDGAFIVFESRASNLVQGDQNNVSDIFVVGPGITLTAIPEIGMLGQPVTLDLFAGQSQTPMAIFTTGVNGTPLQLPVAFGTLGTSGNASLSDLVPAGMVGLEVGFVGASLGWHGGLVISNEVVVPFQQ